MKDGFRTLAANQFCQETNFYELIPIELCVRSILQRLPNVYTVLHYSTTQVQEFSPEIHKLIQPVFPDIDY